jgi:hypothetical protein
MQKIDLETRSRLLKAICADPEIRDLVIRGTDFSPPEVEPVYDPDRSYVSPELSIAKQKAEEISKSIAPDVDTSVFDFVKLFLEARREITKDIKNRPSG